MHSDTGIEKFTRPAAHKGCMALSLAHLSLIDTSPPQLMRIAGEAGFDFVDLRLAPATPADRVYTNDELVELCRSLRPILHETAVRVWDVEIIRVNDQTRPENYLPLMEAAATLGAERMKIVCDSDNHARAAETLGRLCDLAASFGLVMDIEYMIFSGIRSLRAVVELIQIVGRPNLRVLIDALHWVRAGDTAKLELLPPQLLGYIQFCDGPLNGPTDRQALIQEARTNRLAPGEGEFPLDALLAFMPQQCVASVEVPLPAGTEPYAHARRLFEATRKVMERHDHGGGM